MPTVVYKLEKVGIDGCLPRNLRPWKSDVLLQIEAVAQARLCAHTHTLSLSSESNSKF